MSKENHNRLQRLKYWWVIPILFVLQSVAVVLAIKCGAERWMQALTVGVWLLFLPVLLIHLIILIKGRHWMKLIGSFVMEMIPAGMAGVFMAIKGVKLTWRVFAMFLASILWPYVDPSDGFGKEHPIPEGTEYCIPLEKHWNVVDGEWMTDYEEALVDSTDTTSWLQIWNDSEGGRYLYDFYYPALSAGTVYLKCYEVGYNICLSGNVMRRNTSVGCNATKSFSKLVEKQEFVIYEGDWGDYYAVRVEVWHRDSTTHREGKLMEKVYRMEGWMR